MVDVRTPEEYASGHLEGAISMDWNSGQFEREMAALDKERPVLLYCGSGRRSEMAMSAMQQAGFKDVRHMAGGIQAWGRAGKAVVR